LKAPVVCVLGNVDAGKTSLLDKIKKTNIQDQEAGGITQSISSIWINAKNSKTGLPGALIIDTPGHDSFEHLRELGAQVCNFVILMVDINESLKQQTIRAINIIKKNRIPFVVALNKVDRIYGWKSPSTPTLFKSILESQKQDTQRYFYERIDEINYQMNQHGFNSCLYFLNDDPKKQVSLLPVSARTGDGIIDLLNYVLTLSHKFMLSELTYSSEKPEGVVLGYEILKGFGSSIDLILTNGQIEPKHKILIETINGVEEHEINMVLSGGNQKGKYNSEKSLKATQNCKIIIKNLNLNTLILGRPIHWINPSWSESQIKELSQKTSTELDKIIEDFTPTYSKYGVSVHSSSFGGLRAITNFLDENNIPYFRARVGKIKKSDITSTEFMNQKIKNNKNFYNILVGFDVDFDFDINTFDTEKISTVILSDNIIYSLYDKITNHIESQKKIYYDSINEKVPYPVEISVIDRDHIFANKNPILIGVKILTGILKIGTPLMALDPNLEKENNQIIIGFITGIKNRKQQNITEANENEEVSVKIEPLDGFTIKQIDRDFAWDSRIITYYTTEQYQMGLDYLYVNYPKKVQRLFDEYTV
jgi:translation initiation factor 5B